MGRLVAIALAMVAAGITVVAVNGPGKDKPAERDAATPARQSSTVADSTPSAAKPAGAAATGKPAAAVVRMKGLRYRPAQVSVDVGQTVRFVNDDDVAHTVLQDFGPRSGEIAAVDSDRILPGESFDFVPRSEGLVSFVCTLHPSVMHGQILVEKPAT
jgi:plastocyanin